MRGRTLIVLLIICGPLLADAPGLVVRNGELRSAPTFSAGVLRRVTPGTAVTLLQRRGGWQEVALRDGAARGWMRGYQVRANALDSAVVESSRDRQRGVLSDLAALSRAASGLFGARSGAGAGGTTATVGIRGLSAEELESAEPDLAQLGKLKSYSVAPRTASAFAAEARLRARRVRYIGSR